MTEPEQKLFFLPNKRLSNCLTRCLRVLTPYSAVVEALDEMAPRFAGAGRDPFLIGLHSLAKLAEREEVNVSEIGLLLVELMETIDGGTILAEGQDAAGFIDDMNEFIFPMYLAAVQLWKNSVKTIRPNSEQEQLAKLPTDGVGEEQ